MRLYFDANVLIRAIEGRDSIARRLNEILDLAEQGECEIVTSELSLAETVVGPLQKLSIDPTDMEAIERKRLFQSFAGQESVVKMQPISREVLFNAAAFRAARAAIKLPDALHLATYVVTRSEIFVSGDKRLRAAVSAAQTTWGSVCSLDEPELAAIGYRITG